METNSFAGCLIVIEGIDGSGKDTQARSLVRHLRRKGYRVAKVDFPQYGKRSAGAVEEYLRGRYGPHDEVGPYRASVLYAVDRYDLSFRIRRRLEEGWIVVSDRYVASSIGHQGGKIRSKEERKGYVEWLSCLEYGLFGIPRPDATFILKTSSILARKLAPKITDARKLKKRKAYLGSKKRDIHENSPSHQQNALDSYLWAAKEFPKEFEVIECMEGDGLLPKKVIHQMIWEIVQGVLQAKKRRAKTRS